MVNKLILITKLKQPEEDVSIRTLLDGISGDAFGGDGEDWELLATFPIKSESKNEGEFGRNF